MALSKRLQEKYKFALLFISHDLDLVQSFCDRIVVMENGSIQLDSEGGNSISFDQYRHKKKTESGQAFDNQAQTESIISIHNLNHHYKKKKSLFSKTTPIPSLHNVSFSVRKSEIIGLVGPSGSGKSTIAKLLTGFEIPISGKLMFGEIDLVEAWRNQDKVVRQKIQIIFQNPFSSLNPKQRVGDCLKEVLRLRKIVAGTDIDQQCSILLESVGLSDEFLDRLPQQMSGGQQQRVSIARALAMQPEVLICDECVSALDTKTKYEFLDCLLYTSPSPRDATLSRMPSSA